MPFPSSDRYTPPSDPSPNLQTVLAYTEARNEQWGGDMSKMLDLFDASLEHRILPASLCRPILNKKQYSEYMRGIMPFFKSYKMTLHEVIEAGDDKIVFHASSEGVSASDIPFTNEYSVIMHFVPPPDGGLPKICFVKEFVDSASVVKFFKTERENAAARRAEG